MNVLTSLSLHMLCCITSENTAHALNAEPFPEHNNACKIAQYRKLGQEI